MRRNDMERRARQWREPPTHAGSKGAPPARASERAGALHALAAVEEGVARRGGWHSAEGRP